MPFGETTTDEQSKTLPLNQTISVCYCCIIIWPRAVLTDQVDERAEHVLCGEQRGLQQRVGRALRRVRRHHAQPRQHGGLRRAHRAQGHACQTKHNIVSPYTT